LFQLVSSYGKDHASTHVPVGQILNLTAVNVSKATLANSPLVFPTPEGDEMFAPLYYTYNNGQSSGNAIFEVPLFKQFITPSSNGSGLFDNFGMLPTRTAITYIETTGFNVARLKTLNRQTGAISLNYDSTQVGVVSPSFAGDNTTLEVYPLDIRTGSLRIFRLTDQLTNPRVIPTYLGFSGQMSQLWGFVPSNGQGLLCGLGPTDNPNPILGFWNGDNYSSGVLQQGDKPFGSAIASFPCPSFQNGIGTIPTFGSDGSLSAMLSLADPFITSASVDANGVLSISGGNFASANFTARIGVASDFLNLQPIATLPATATPGSENTQLTASTAGLKPGTVYVTVRMGNAIISNTIAVTIPQPPAPTVVAMSDGVANRVLQAYAPSGLLTLWGTNFSVQQSIGKPPFGSMLGNCQAVFDDGSLARSCM
jgi:hypothetical protein